MDLFGRQAERRRRYVTDQVYEIAPRFTSGNLGVEYDEQDCRWIKIPRYPMPERWKQRWTSLLVMLPDGYPDVPPTGFYLSVRLGLKSGGWDTHLFRKGFHGAADLSDAGWFWYCVLPHLDKEGGWRPSADPREPDNLWSFLNMCREALSSDE